MSKKKLWYSSEGFSPTEGPEHPPKTVDRSVILSMKSLASNIPKKIKEEAKKK